MALTNEQIENRMRICKKCEFYKLISKYSGSICKKCGCVLDFKVKLTNTYCPENKW